MTNDFEFEAKDLHVQEVLFNDYNKFVIPRFQRPYTWTEDHLSDFWNDLISSDKSYFLGSLIFNTENKKDSGYLEIIDGQQRLLTITIFCAVIRDILCTISIEDAKFCQRKDILIEGRNRSEFRIKPGDSTRSYFRKYVQEMGNDILSSTPKTTEENRIKENYKYFLEKLTVELSKYD